jgi:hypothetical protein
MFFTKFGRHVPVLLKNEMILDILHEASPAFLRFSLPRIPWVFVRAIITDLLTYLLTPWIRILLEKLTDFQLVKEFPAFYGTRRFITAFTSARHLSLSWASSIHSLPPHPTSWRSILILSSQIRLVLPSGLFPSGFPTKSLYTPRLSPYALHARPSHSSRYYHPNQVGWGVQVIKLLIM